MEQTNESIDQLMESLLLKGEQVVQQIEELGLDKKIYSDVIDKESGKYQYVNLVQEGGGVWGIALLGFTYVLERAGIRFAKMAGTSAGAINTMMLASLRNPQNDEIASAKVLYYLANKNLFDLVDGHPLAKWFIKNIASKNNYFGKMLSSILFMLAISLFLMFFGSILVWNNPSDTAGLFFWVFVALIFSSIAFGKNLNTEPNALDKQTKKSFITDALWFFGPMMLLLISALIITYSSTSVQNIIETCILCACFTISLFLFFSKNHISGIQLLCSAILIVVLVLQIDYRFCGASIFGFLKNLLDSKTNALPNFHFLTFAGVSLFIFFLLFIVGIVIFLYVRFKNSSFGINPGNDFLNWITDLMKNGSIDKEYTISPKGKERKISIKNGANKIETLHDLEKKMNNLPQLKHRLDQSKDLTDLEIYNSDEPQLVIISAEIETENKIEFPKMYDLFWEDKSLNPAIFVRASMAIPVFFEPVKKNTTIDRKKWMFHLNHKFGEKQSFVDARFVDGGSLSNFPINVFYKQGLETPRLPTFGVRLSDEETKTKFDVFGSYVGKMISTMRYYYDKDFLIKHRFFNQCIADINVNGFNWLDFNMANDKKVKLFELGALKAKDFLENFDWEKYKSERTEFRQDQNATIESEPDI